MFERSHIKDALKAAFPIMLGYVGIGIPCGILGSSIGLNAIQVFIMSIFFYSGAGQFMIPNMWIAGSPIASIIASVSMVNTRQILYAASFAPRCVHEKNWLSFLFAFSVTDESFGVNTDKFNEGGWSVDRATLVNLFSRFSWAISNVVGVFIGSAINIPLPVAAFAMTAIFICLTCGQKFSFENICAIVFAILGVYVAKAVGLSGAAILIGALVGIVAAIIASKITKKFFAKNALKGLDSGKALQDSGSDDSFEGEPLIGANDKSSVTCEEATEVSSDGKGAPNNDACVYSESSTCDELDKFDSKSSAQEVCS